MTGSVMTAAALTGLSAMLLVASLRLPATAAAVPIVVSVPTLLLLLHQLVRESRRDDEEPAAGENALPARERSTLVWMAGLLLLMWLLGVVIALPAYLVLHLRVRSRERWVVAITTAGAAWFILFFGLGWLLEVPPPPGILWAWIAGS